MPWSKSGIYYRLEGVNNPNARKIILLMGMGGCHQDFYLMRQFFGNFFQICSIDNVGTGFSRKSNTRKRKGETTSSMADDVIEIVNELGWKSINLAGLSMGGMIAQEVVCRISLDINIETLILICTSNGMLKHITNIPNPTMLSILLKIFLGRGKSSEKLEDALKLMFRPEWLQEKRQSDLHGNKIVTNMKWIIKHMVWRSEDMPQEVMTDSVFNTWNSMQPPNISVFFSQVFAVLSHNLTNEKARIIQERVPHRVVLGGENDTLTKIKNNMELAKQIQCPLHILKCGHGLLEEQEQRAHEIMYHTLFPNGPSLDMSLTNVSGGSQYNMGEIIEPAVSEEEKKKCDDVDHEDNRNNTIFQEQLRAFKQLFEGKRQRISKL